MGLSILNKTIIIFINMILNFKKVNLQFLDFSYNNNKITLLKPIHRVIHSFWQKCYNLQANNHIIIYLFEFFTKIFLFLKIFSKILNYFSNF